MSDSEQTKMILIFSLLVSIIGGFLVLLLDIGGFYLPGYSNRYSCLACEYGTIIGKISAVITAIFLFGQAILIFKSLSSETPIDTNTIMRFILLAVCALVFAVIGGAEFAITYGDYEWWFETGFYGGVISSILNLVLFFVIKNQK
ncbi:MAG: hypothetical protein GY870_20580 [archaeon]|nr:hypothetical protein [archaeon]